VNDDDEVVVDDGVARDLVEMDLMNGSLHIYIHFHFHSFPGAQFRNNLINLNFKKHIK